jgi:8-oxo-dGTP pyrophosphatase MutT (NUDIX family)
MKSEEENPFKKVATKAVYENPWIKVREDQIINPSGNPGIYGVVEFKKVAIAILPLDENNNTWIVGQYRYPHDTYEWEIPEGGCELGEDPLDTAKRELLEETGIIAGDYEKILDMQLSNSTTNEISISYIARNLSFSQCQPEETEVLKVKKIPFETLKQMVINNEIRDSLTIATVLKADQIINNPL